MFDRDKWDEIYHVLAANPIRTFLTAFGVFWGLFMLVIMLGAGKGLENGVTSEFQGKPTNSSFMWTMYTSKPYKGLPRGRSFRMRNGDVDALRQNVEELDLLCPRNQLGGFGGSNNVIRGLRNGEFDVYGDYPDYIKIEPRDIIQGRFINKIDIEQDRKVAVIGKRVYTDLFDQGEDAIGAYIQINGVYFMVVGIFDSYRSGEDAFEDTQNIHLPFTTFQRVFNFGDFVSWMAMTSKQGVPVSLMEDKVKLILANRHQVDPTDPRAFGSYDMEREFMRMNNLFTGIRGLAWIVGFFTLLAGVVGISNIMLVLVKERTREIGVRRAMGATPWNITSQIILEALLLTSVAGFCGLFVGVWSIESVRLLLEGEQGGSFRNPEVQISTILTALGILIFCGTLAGLIPARRAVNIKPIDALRSE